MRILVIGGRLSLMQHEIRSMCGPGVEHYSTRCIVETDDSYLHYTVLIDEMDLDRFRGQRFDVILEHSTFRGERRLLDILRTMVLR